MLHSTKKLATGAAAALIGSSVLSGATFINAADAAPTTHTLKFVAITDREHGAGRNGFMGTDINRNHGRFVGYDMISGTFNRRTQSVKIYVAVARKGGLMFGRLHSTSGATFVGRVTGGNGRFAGAKGTITARNAPHNDNRTFVTIHFTLP